MSSGREAAITALVTAIEGTGALVFRTTDLEREVPPEGMIEVTEGEDSVQTILSPLTYLHDLEAQVAVTIDGIDEKARDAMLDTLLMKVSQALDDDRTLGGAVDHLEIGTPVMNAFEGSGAGKTAQFPVTLMFTTVGSPLA